MLFAPPPGYNVANTNRQNVQGYNVPGQQGLSPQGYNASAPGIQPQMPTAGGATNFNPAITPASMRGTGFNPTQGMMARALNPSLGGV